jgi:ribosomal protein L14E/L6E/L27E
MQLQVGSVVRATAGKEQGGFYLVTALEGQYVLLADGKRRPLERPKRKNLRHIAPSSTVWEMHGLTDRELRRRLQDFAAKGGI